VDLSRPIPLNRGKGRGKRTRKNKEWRSKKGKDVIILSEITSLTFGNRGILMSRKKRKRKDGSANHPSRL